MSQPSRLSSLTARLPQNWKMVGQLIAFLAPYRVRLALGLLAGVGFAGVNSGMLLIIRHIGNTAFHGQSPSTASMIQHSAKEAGGPGIEAYIWMGLMIPAIMILRSFMAYANVYFLTWVGLRALRDMRHRVFKGLMAQSMDFFNKSHAGLLMSRVLNDSSVAGETMVQIVGDVVKQPLTAIGAMGTLFYIDWKFTLISLVLFPVCIVPVVIYGRRVRHASRGLQSEAGMMGVILQESFAGIRVIKSFSREDFQLALFDRSCDDQFGISMKVRKSSSIVQPMIETVSAFGVSLALVYVYFAHMTVGSFLALMGGMFLLYDPIKNISRIHVSIEACVGAAMSIMDLLATKPSIEDRPDAVALQKSRGQLVLENVSFTYGAAAKNENALTDANLIIEPGMKVALVGASGAGKSTILSLLMRFYDPQKGRLLIDGHDLRDVTLHSLHDQIGIVSQDTFLFHDTIYENIRFGRLDATRDEIEEAARLAHAHEFIMDQPHGYETKVGDKGCLLSGGQQQRLSIARALLKAAPILLLDEATSALDSESERMIQDALEKLAKGRTVIAIAHRLSTILGSDMIVVMDQGCIVATGTHAELLQSSEHYSKLYNLQFNHVNAE